MSDSAKISKAHCNHCLRDTRQFIVASKTMSYSEDLGSYCESTNFEMLECCGCENITFRSVFRNNDEPDPTVTYFPPAVTRPTPRWLSDAAFWLNQRDLRSLFLEVYAALHAGSNRLAMMGARTLIDMVILNKIGDQGSFAEKLKKMESEGHISGTNRAYLEAAIEAGSAAAHRGYCPNNKDVNRVMDIVESLVQSVYVLESAAQTLRQNTPTRRAQTTKGTGQS